MPITVIPPVPLRSQGKPQDQYSAEMEASLSALPLMAADMNAAATLAQLTTTTTSSSSVLIGTGSKTFTVTTGLGFVVGMTLRIANSSTNYMTGEVASYNTGTGALVVNVPAGGTVGSGTFANWTISLAAVGANAAGAVSFTPAGNIAATNVQSAIQELDTEKLSSAAGAVTSSNLNTIITGGTVGSVTQIPVITYDAKGRITAATVATTALGASSAVRTNTANGYGSTNTKIRRFSTVVTNTGTDITYADSATLGASFTINTEGLYSITYCDGFSSPAVLGISLNSTQLTTNLESITTTNVLAIATNGSANYVACTSWVGKLSVGDVLRPHSAGIAVGTVVNGVQFTISRVG